MLGITNNIRTAVKKNRVFHPRQYLKAKYILCYARTLQLKNLFDQRFYYACLCIRRIFSNKEEPTTTTTTISTEIIWLQKWYKRSILFMLLRALTHTFRCGIKIHTVWRDDWIFMCMYFSIYKILIFSPLFHSMRPER